MFPIAARGPETWVIDEAPHQVSATYYLAFETTDLQYTIEVPVEDVPSTEQAALVLALPLMKHAVEKKFHERSSPEQLGQGRRSITRIGTAFFRGEGASARGCRVARSLEEIRHELEGR